ncbi:MAG: dephospho-CoA kinase [Bdellovibrionales bacterium]|nr:dephospho-CoA kinase [Bdellovibrionales bacterium]
MKWIGLTGGLATGKSVVSQILREKGYPVIDADLLAREVVKSGQPALSEIVTHFGSGILLPSGELDRKKLGEIVFADGFRRELLEEIIHPKIRQLVTERKTRLKSQGIPLAFYDVPLLIEKRLEKDFDTFVLVYAPISKQLERVMNREGYTHEEASRRLFAQLPIDEKRAKAPWVIENTGSIEHLRREVNNFLFQLVK